MKQQTELMRQILKNETAQKIIDYVSPIYGNSYVALWIYEVIGIVLSEACQYAEKLRDETNPITTELLMDYWEAEYGLHKDSRLTMEQRRERLLRKIRDRAPCNPKRLAEAVSVVLGVPVNITERVAKNTFRVDILNSVNDFNKLLHAIEVLDGKKPAHLIYEINVDSPVDETNLKLAAATTQAETYKVGIEAVKLVLQTTVEKAIKLGASVTLGEQYFVSPQPITVDTQTNVEHYVSMASPVFSKEEYSVADIKQAARIAVETAFNIASPVSSSEEFNIEEVTTE